MKCGSCGSEAPDGYWHTCQPILTRRAVPDRIRSIARQAGTGQITLNMVALALYALADDLEAEGK